MGQENSSEASDVTTGVQTGSDGKSQTLPLQKKKGKKQRPTSQPIADLGARGPGLKPVETFGDETEVGKRINPAKDSTASPDTSSNSAMCAKKSDGERMKTTPEDIVAPAASVSSKDPVSCVTSLSLDCRV